MKQLIQDWRKTLWAIFHPHRNNTRYEELLDVLETQVRITSEKESELARLRKLLDQTPLEDYAEARQRRIEGGPSHYKCCFQSAPEAD